MQYRSEIDGLRAIAVIPVILFHAGFEQFSGGFVGVDVFFVISGYLITTIILSEKEQGSFSIVNFYERRARRILPVLFFVMALCLPAAWFWLLPSDLKDFSQSLIAVSLFSSNILFWQETGYFGAANELKPLLHTWSLAVEEQYYILFPIFLTLLWGFRKRWILASFLSIASISFLLSEWASYRHQTANFFLLPTRGWELAIGASIAFYFLYKKQTIRSLLDHKFLDEVAGLLGLGMIFCAVFFFSKSTPFPGAYALVPTIGTGLIILFASPDTFVGRLLSYRLFVGIGLISYSAYLWHQPLFAFLHHYSYSKPNEVTMVLMIFVTLALSFLSWKFIENPFRKRDKVTRVQVFSLSLIGSVLFISIGALGHVTDGFLKYKTTVLERELLSSAESSPKRKECHTQGWDYIKPGDACEYFKKDPGWATFGDSHTVELAYAMSQELKELGEGVKHFSYSACPPMYLRESVESALHDCAKWTNETIDFIAEDKKLKNIVYSYRINAALFGKHEDVYPAQPNNVDESERERRWESYVKTVERFVNSDKKVFVVLQAPELRANMEKLIVREGYSDGKLVSVPFNWWEQRNEFVRSRINDLPEGVVVIDPSKLFCDLTNCYAVKDNKSLYFDDDHMSVFGASIIAKEVIIKAANY